MMKLLYKIWEARIIIGIVVIYIFFYVNTPTYEDEVKGTIDAYRAQQYSGVIINKYIDKEQHLFKKIIIKEGNNERTLLFDAEIGGIYDFFSIGDSIVKKENSLKVKIVRRNKDSIFQMRFHGDRKYRN